MLTEDVTNLVDRTQDRYVGGTGGQNLQASAGTTTTMDEFNDIVIILSKTRARTTTMTTTTQSRQ